MPWNIIHILTAANSINQLERVSKIFSQSERSTAGTVRISKNISRVNAEILFRIYVNKTSYVKRREENGGAVRGI